MSDDEAKTPEPQSEDLSEGDVEFVTEHLSDEATEDIIAGEAAGPLLGETAGPLFGEAG